MRHNTTDLLSPMMEEHGSLFIFNVSSKVAWGVPPFWMLSQPVAAINNVVILSCCEHANHVTHLDDSVNSRSICYCHNNSISVEAKPRKTRG